MNRIQKRTLSLLLGIAMLIPMAGSAFAATNNTLSGIYVASQGQIEANPDYAVVSLGVNTNNVDASKARNENAKTVAKVTEALTKQGVAEKDIKNRYLNMYPNYDYQSGKQVLIGYQVENNLSITVRDLNKLSDTVNAALNAGANNLSNVYYDVNDRDAYYAKAVKKAMDSARSKATTIAKESGLTLGKITSVNESGYAYPSEAYAGSNVRLDSSEMEDTSIAADLGNTLKPVPVTISVSLNVSFAVN